MAKPDWDEPEPVVISRRALDAALMAMLLISCLTVSTVVVFMFAKELIRERSLFNALFFGLGTPLLLGGNLYVVVYWSRVASQAEFGDTIELRTLFSRRRYRWTKLGRLVLMEQSWSIPSRYIVKMIFTDGSRCIVFANRQQGKALFRLARQQPWAREWAGAPLSTGVALTFIGLGIVAMFLELLIICDPVADVVRNGIANNRAGINSENIGGLILVAFVVPLAGLAGIGAGGYHLIRRPIVIRPGIVRRREGEMEHL